MRIACRRRKPIVFAAVSCFFIGLATACPAQTVCYRVENVDFWDILYIRSKPDFRSTAVGGIAPDHNGIIRGTGPCRPSGISRKRQWCPVDYFPLPEVRKSGFIKAFFIRKAPCPRSSAAGR
jgi:hypothetical protein